MQRTEVARLRSGKARERPPLPLQLALSSRLLEKRPVRTSTYAICPSTLKLFYSFLELFFSIYLRSSLTIAFSIRRGSGLDHRV